MATRLDHFVNLKEVIMKKPEREVPAGPPAEGEEAAAADPAQPWPRLKPKGINWPPRRPICRTAC